MSKEREEIEKLAEDACRVIWTRSLDFKEDHADADVELVTNTILTQVEKARAEAIEECAKIAIESESQYCLSEDEKNTAIRIAEAIRRRLYE